jgi:hypothetical protein
MAATQARMFVHPIRDKTVAVDARKQIFGRAIAMPAAREAAEQQYDDEVTSCLHT